MHEMSLVRSLLSQIEGIVNAQGGGTIREIRLRCGPLSGIEPALISSAFEVLRDQRGFYAASLVVEEVPLEVRCETCHSAFHPQRFQFDCPECGGAETTIVQGDAVVLESIEYEPLSEGAFV